MIADPGGVHRLPARKQGAADAACCRVRHLADAVRSWTFDLGPRIAAADILHHDIHQVVATGSGAKLVESSFLHEPALVQQPEPVAKPGGFIELMCADQYGLALIAQVGNVIEDDLAPYH